MIERELSETLSEFEIEGKVLCTYFEAKELVVALLEREIAYKVDYTDLDEDKIKISNY